jgi:hypothetical protein
MVILDAASLSRARGGADEGGEPGPNQNRYRGTDGTETFSSLSNPSYCLNVLERNCDRANPGMLWGTNDKASGTCVVDAMKNGACRPPQTTTAPKP